jgi:hypothetical protein
MVIRYRAISLVFLRFDPEKTGKVALDDIFKIYALLFRFPNRMEEMYVNSFQEFDKDNAGLLPIDDFKKHMESYGEQLRGNDVRMSEADDIQCCDVPLFGHCFSNTLCCLCPQLTQICKDAEPDPQGQLHYIDFVQRILAADQPKPGKKKTGKKTGKTGKAGKAGKAGKK